MSCNSVHQQNSQKCMPFITFLGQEKRSQIPFFLLFCFAIIDLLLFLLLQCLLEERERENKKGGWGENLSHNYHSYNK